MAMKVDKNKFAQQPRTSAREENGTETVTETPAAANAMTGGNATVAAQARAAAGRGRNMANGYDENGRAIGPVIEYSDPDTLQEDLMEGVRQRNEVDDENLDRLRRDTEGMLRDHENAQTPEAAAEASEKHKKVPHWEIYPYTAMPSKPKNPTPAEEAAYAAAESKRKKLDPRYQKDKVKLSTKVKNWSFDIVDGLMQTAGLKGLIEFVDIFFDIFGVDFSSDSRKKSKEKAEAKKQRNEDLFNQMQQENLLALLENNQKQAGPTGSLPLPAPGGGGGGGNNQPNPDAPADFYDAVDGALDALDLDERIRQNIYHLYSRINSAKFEKNNFSYGIAKEQRKAMQKQLEGQMAQLVKLYGIMRKPIKNQADLEYIRKSLTELDAQVKTIEEQIGTHRTDKQAQAKLEDMWRKMYGEDGPDDKGPKGPGQGGGDGPDNPDHKPKGPGTGGDGGAEQPKPDKKAELAAAREELKQAEQELEDARATIDAAGESAALDSSSYDMMLQAAQEKVAQLRAKVQKLGGPVVGA